MLPLVVDLLSTQASAVYFVFECFHNMSRPTACNLAVSDASFACDVIDAVRLGNPWTGFSNQYKTTRIAWCC